MISEITGADLLAWRLSAVLSQADAAAMIGLPVGTYVEYERGDRPIRYPRLVALACAAIAEGVPPWRTPPDMHVERPRRGRPRKKAAVI